MSDDKPTCNCKRRNDLGLAGLIMAIVDLFLISIIHSAKLSIFIFAASTFVLCILALTFCTIGVLRRPRFFALIGLGVSVLDLSLVLAALRKIMEFIEGVNATFSRFGYGY